MMELHFLIWKLHFYFTSPFDRRKARNAHRVRLYVYNFLSVCVCVCGAVYIISVEMSFLLFDTIPGEWDNLRRDLFTGRYDRRIIKWKRSETQGEKGTAGLIQQLELYTLNDKFRCRVYRTTRRPSNRSLPPTSPEEKWRAPFVG